MTKKKQAKKKVAKKAAKPAYHIFTNESGLRLHVPSKMTAEDLALAGIRVTLAPL
jgi:hypothetical protein